MISSYLFIWLVGIGITNVEKLKAIKRFKQTKNTQNTLLSHFKRLK
ncbi:hypothetical protein SAMN05421827_10976 [Pedobacter terrae]|uniref:Uncharacterized protein n=1 Tax=Pedobacter terrae TaxID=405671 RepID=A0A1G7W2S4_9SPHI|nr:hypothetical protein SAMN05421827_10976 [Pedobacter terrae]